MQSVILQRSLNNAQLLCWLKQYRRKHSSTSIRRIVSFTFLTGLFFMPSLFSITEGSLTHTGTPWKNCTYAALSPNQMMIQHSPSQVQLNPDSDAAEIAVSLKSTLIWFRVEGNLCHTLRIHTAIGTQFSLLFSNHAHNLCIAQFQWPCNIPFLDPCKYLVLSGKKVRYIFLLRNLVVRSQNFNLFIILERCSNI